MAENALSIEERISAALAPEMPQEAPQEPAQEALQEAPQEALQEAPQEPQQEPEVPQEAAQEEVEEITLSEMGDLAEHLGIDMADLYQLALPYTDPDGNSQRVTLSELKDGYQASQKAQARAREAQELRESLQKQQQEQAESFQRQAHELANYFNFVDQQMQADFSKINWDQLRAENPTEWAARRQEMQERAAQVQLARQQAAQQYDQQLDFMRQQAEENLSQLARREWNALLNAFPRWQDDGVRQAEQAAIQELLLDVGYSPEEIDSAYDSRAIRLAYEALQYRKSKQAGDVAKKKVVKLGKKVLKPGAKVSKAQANQDRESALRAKLRESGHTDDAARLISMRLGRS